MMLSILQDVQRRLGGLEDRMSRPEASQDDMAETFSSQMLVLRGTTNGRLDDMYGAIPTLREEVRATLAEHRLASQSEIELLKAQGNLHKPGRHTPGTRPGAGRDLRPVRHGYVRQNGPGPRRDQPVDGPP